MELLVEQLFYGRGERGYGILGESPGGVPFAPRVESICDTVGTPIDDYGDAPFLVSVPEDDHVIMVCGRLGALDSMGRGTLFFHALVALKDDLEAAKADAFSLFSQGVFVERMPSREVVALRIEATPSQAISAKLPTGERMCGKFFPCVFRSEKPSPDIVHAAVCGRALDLAWATFAFQPMEGFDVQVLPPRLTVPRQYNMFDSVGRLLRASSRSVETSPDSRLPQPSASRNSTDVELSASESKCNLERPASRFAFLASIAANLLLAVCCLVLWATRKTDSAITAHETPANRKPAVVTNYVPASVSLAQTNEIKRIVLNELAGAFPRDKRIGNFAEEVAVLPQYKSICFDEKFKSANLFLERLEANVAFLNTNLFLKTENDNATGTSN